jgi:hypothetical protein
MKHNPIHFRAEFIINSGKMRVQETDTEYEQDGRS